MGATFGLIAGGILKGIGDARQQDAVDARAQALDDLKERRRDAETHQKRVWDVEDRNYLDAKAGERAVAAQHHEDNRDDVRTKRDKQNNEWRDARDEKNRAAQEERTRLMLAGRDGEVKTPGQVVAPILARQAKGEIITKAEQAVLDYYAKLDPREIRRRDGGSGGGAPASDEGGDTTPAPRTAAPSIVPAAQAPAAGDSPVDLGIAGPGFSAPAPSAAPAKKVMSKGEFDALPSGSSFIAPDGSRRIKP